METKMETFHLSTKAKKIAAKSGRETVEGWLPLWMHLLDTAGIMELLIRKWVPAATETAAGMPEESFRRTGVFLAAVHDLGKATAVFESRIVLGIPGLREALEASGLPLPQLSWYSDPQHTHTQWQATQSCVRWAARPGLRLL
jgi:CRISPR-associated endonuclease/helicase Cas3